MSASRVAMGVLLPLARAVEMAVGQQRSCFDRGLSLG